MFLKNIELTNFKCHSHFKLSFETADSKKPIRKTTFLLGENGTGKSAVLKAIALVTAGSNALADLLSNPDSWIQNKKKFCLIQATIGTVKGEERHIKLKINRGSHIREILNENYESLEELDDAIAKADRNYFILAYGASRRLSAGNSKLFNKEIYSRSPRTKGIQSLFNTDAPLVSLANWAMDLDYSSNGSNLTTIKSSINSFLVENVKFKRIDKSKGQLIFSTSDGEIPLEQLSDGYQNVIAWIGDLMYNVTNTFRDYKSPLKARGVLLIDEVDLHLHPKWQRRLHAFLQKKLPNFQIILTTHSPLTVQQAGENELYALRRSGKGIQTVPFIGDPSKMLLHQVLMSPIFGVESDESVEVEEAKERIREINLKQKPTAKEKKEVKDLSDNISTLPANIRTNSRLDSEDVKLLKTINEALTKLK